MYEAWMQARGGKNIHSVIRSDRWEPQLNNHFPNLHWFDPWQFPSEAACESSPNLATLSFTMEHHTYIVELHQITSLDAIRVTPTTPFHGTAKRIEWKGHQTRKPQCEQTKVFTRLFGTHHRSHTLAALPNCQDKSTVLFMEVMGFGKDVFHVANTTPFAQNGQPVDLALINTSKTCRLQWVSQSEVPSSLLISSGISKHKKKNSYST